MKPRDAHSLGPQYVLRYSDARASSRSQGALPPLMTLRGYCVSCLWFHRITYAERQYVDRMFEFVHMQASSPIMSKIPARECMSWRLGTLQCPLGCNLGLAAVNGIPIVSSG